jgi:hypothetical protein
MKSWLVLSTFLVCAVACGAAGVAAADNPKSAEKSGAAAAKRPSRTLKIFPVQNARADTILGIVREVVGAKGTDSVERARFAVDEARNTIIVSGDLETLRTVEALILALDQQKGPAESEPQTKVFELRYIDPREAQLSLMQLGLKGVNSFPNSRTKSLIVNGQKEAVERIVKLIHILDVPPAPTPRPADVSIRVVWLVDKSLAIDDTAPVPGDLVSAFATLRKKIEIGELRTATQMIVNVNPADSSRFDVSGTARLKQSVNLRLSGSMTQNGTDENRLRLQFSATSETRQESQHPICSLDTTCSALVPGNPVIVGMTTVSSQPSVFVIELLPK